MLHPLLTRVNPEYLVAELLYSSLTRLKPDMTAEPDLAESWSAERRPHRMDLQAAPGRDLP